MKKLIFNKSSDQSIKLREEKAFETFLFHPDIKVDLIRQIRILLMIDNDLLLEMKLYLLEEIYSKMKLF